MTNQKRQGGVMRSALPKAEAPMPRSGKVMIRKREPPASTGGRENAAVPSAGTYSQRYASRQAESIRKSLESGKLSDGRAVTPVIRETLEKSLADYEAQEQDPNRGSFTRFGNMTKGGAKGSLSGNMDLMGLAYQVGQGSRTGQNQELAGEYGGGLERARGTWTPCWRITRSPPGPGESGM